MRPPIVPHAMHPCGRQRASRPNRGFSLLEVTIAIGIFFMVAFTILALVSRSLRMARALQVADVPIASPAAELSLTNQLEEGMLSGDLGEDYPEHDWDADITEFTNGLYHVDIKVMRRGKMRPDGEMSILLYRPMGAAGARPRGPRR